MHILILEDEPKTAAGLCEMLYALRPDYTIVGCLPSVEEALSWFATHPHPDLIVSDIQLADGLCFALFEQLPEVIPVLFCTAFDHYAITAFENFGIDYVLKPVAESRLEKGLQKFEELIRKREVSDAENYAARFTDTLEELRVYRETIVVSYKDVILPVETSRIAYIHSEQGLVRLHTLQGKKYVLSVSLDELEKTLNPQHFFRANRQFILHKPAVAHAKRSLTRRLFVTLHLPEPQEIIVSKARAALFVNWLDS